jgi:serine O-acetyltransferase
MNEQIKPAVEDLLKSYEAEDDARTKRLGAQPLPASVEVCKIIAALQELIFPGFFGTQGLSGEILRWHVVERMDWLFDALSEQIKRAAFYGETSAAIQDPAEVATALLKKLPHIRRLLATDTEAAFAGDPAASCREEVIASYPGLFATFVYRIAHELFKLKVPLIPRMMTEHAHALTGIDIHPQTQIGDAFFIDHGTGVVIGGTAVIGNRVKIYQGVTLGAFSFPKDAEGNLIRNTKRHPTIEDDVVIYAGATILGGTTVIGRGSAIGGNVWLTKSVPPFSKVSQEQPNLKIVSPQRQDTPQFFDYVI